MIDLANIIVSIIILGLVVERTAELLSSANIFAPLRNLIALQAYPPDAAPLGPFEWDQLGRRFALFVTNALGCGYCTSVWVAMPVALVCPLPFVALAPFDWAVKVVL